MSNRARADKLCAMTNGEGCRKSDLLDAMEAELNAAEQRGAEREREACAQFILETYWTDVAPSTARNLAAAIRARSES